MSMGDKIPIGRAKDISGKIFGPFTVLYRCEYKNDRPYWKVKCNNCGAEDIRRGSDLIGKIDKLTCKECGKIRNLTGLKFHKLTVQKEWKRKNNSIYWKCLCDCGKYTWVKSGNLISGEVKSCGCIIYDKEKIDIYKGKKAGEEVPLGNAKNLAGKKFHRLTALYRCVPPNSYSKIHKSAFWLCQCECGNKKIVLGRELQHGKTYSCGCYNKELNKIKIKKVQENYRQIKNAELQDKKIGMVTCLYPTSNKKYGYIVWHCKCDCGREFNIGSNRLRGKDKIYSCGCISGSKGEQKIHHFLFNNDIPFEKEKTFEDFKSNNNNYFRFDFYLPSYNCCIEYDGEQHFKETTMCVDTLQDRQERDNLKTQYCKDNNIKLIRIPYTEFDNIEEILTKELNL